jgi:Polyketide cyclase / dehydrase and lipid transport
VGRRRYQAGGRRALKGHNERGRAKWSTTCTVTVSEPGREFSFVVGPPNKPKTTWSYRFAPSGSGTDVTESWRAERYGFFSKLITKPEKATAALNDGITKTLEALQGATGSD